MTTEHPLHDLLRTLRRDLTAAQGKLTEALRQVAELDLPGEAPASNCKFCGKIPGGPRSLSEHLYVSHDGPVPAHWERTEAMSADFDVVESAAPGKSKDPNHGLTPHV